MSDIHDRVAERMAMAFVGDAYAYQIMAKKRVRAISGGEEPTIEHYRLALEKCIAEKAADWRAACEATVAASKAVGDLKAEVERLRLTEAERAFFELHIERVRWWAHSSRESEAELATVSAMFARLAQSSGAKCQPIVAYVHTPEERRLHEKAEELLDRPAALEAASPRWIPVSERLPDCGTWCLVWWERLAHPFEAMRDRRAIGGWRNGEWEDYYKNVTYWMPMPPIPSPPAKETD